MRKINKAGKIALSAAIAAAVTVSTGTLFKANADQSTVSNFTLPDIHSISSDYNHNGSYNLNVAPGSDATSMGFSWFTQSAGQTQVRIVEASKLTSEDTIPSGVQPQNATQSLVYVTQNIGQTDEVYGQTVPSVDTADLGSDVSGDQANEPGNGAQWGRAAEHHSTGEYSNQITVSNLTPGTQYAYQVSDGKGNWSQVYKVRTLKADSVNFAAVGDPQIGAYSVGNSLMGHTSVADDEDGWNKVLNLITGQSQKPDFLFSMGDQVNDYNYLLQDPTNTEGGQWNQYNYFFSPRGNTALQSTLLAAFSGNHDHQMGQYYGYHYNQSNKSTLGSTQYGNDGDYWFTAGPVLFIVLNANNYGTASHDEFIHNAVSANPNAKWKVAAWHQSAYSESKSHTLNNDGEDPILTIRNTWPKMMDKYGIDVVLQGHDHYYTRTAQMYNGSPLDPDTGSAITDTNWLKTYNNVTGATTGTSDPKATSSHKQYDDSVTDPKGTVYFTLDSGSGSKYYDWGATSDHTFSVKSWQGYVPTYSNVSFTNGQFTIQTYAVENYTNPTLIDSYTITKTAEASDTAGTGGTSNTTSTTVSTAGVTSTTDTGSVSSASNPKTGARQNVLANIVSIVAVALILGGTAFMVLRRKKRV